MQNGQKDESILILSVIGSLRVSVKQYNNNMSMELSMEVLCY